MSQMLWKPTEKQIVNSNLVKFMQVINRKHSTSLSTYNDLYEYSIHNYQFWLDLSDFINIRLTTRPQAAIENESSSLYPPPNFFPGASLNYAENCLEDHRGSQAAVITAKEGATDVCRYTYSTLRSRVHKMSDALRAVGVRKGDRVAGVLGNSIHAVTLVLATASIGAVYSSTATDMGVSGILDRLRQILPKVVLFDNGAFYNGKRHDLTSKAKTVLESIDSEILSAFVIVPNLENHDSNIDHTKASTLEEFLTVQRSPSLVYESVDFAHPLFVMYSSGTTGPPKCIVHSHGGVLLQMRKEYDLHLNMSEGDIFWQYTTTGWMMYQYLITALSSGITIICLDGSPLANIKGLIKFIQDEGVTHFGTSPRWLSELKTQGIAPKDFVDLKNLRCVTSTGSVLVSHLFSHFYASWPAHIQLASVSGGTDLMACFFLGNPIEPVYAGQLQCRALGMSVKAYTAEGTALPGGEPGELVCDRPFPSQPRYFLSDDSGEKYRNAYYTKFPGVWHHGDFIQFESTGGVTMLGRSDGVLNPSGVRFGSAEIYSITERFSEISDSLCVGQRRAQDVDESVILFLILHDSQHLTQDLETRLRKTIGKELSPRHVPRFIFQVEAIPLTINGKKVELVVKQIVSGQMPKVSATIANPECLESYKQYVDADRLATAGRAKL